MKEEENKFDLQIRSILGDATEEVPGDVWSAIERRLDAQETDAVAGKEAAGAKKKVVLLPVWARWASGVAAAAVVAAGLFLSGTFDGIVADRNYNSLAENSEGGIEKIDEKSAGNEPEIRMAEDLHEDIREEAKVVAEIKPAAPKLIAEAIQTTTCEPADLHHKSSENQKLTIEDVAVVETSEKTTESAGNAIEPAEPVSPEPLPSDPTSSEPISSESVSSENDDAEAWAKLLSEDEEQRHGIRTSVTLSGNAISNSNSSVKRDYTPTFHGYGKSELTEDKISPSSESSFSIPVSFGIGAKIDFTKRWSASIGVNYTMLRRTFAGTFFDVHEDGSHNELIFPNIRNRLDYIGIPVNAYFSILSNNFIDFYAYAGGTVEKCVSNAYRMAAEGVNITHKEKVEGVEFSANIGLGMEFIIADLVGIFIDPSLRYYFPSKNQPYSIRSSQPLMFGVELGFRFHL